MEAGVGKAEHEVTSHHDWKPGNFLCPFWLVKRPADNSQCNCEIRLVRTISTMSADTAYTDASEVDIPLMTNFKDIGKHEELIVHWSCVTAKVAPTPKMTTWFDKSQREMSIKRRKT